MLALSQTTGYAILALSCLSDASERFVLARDIAACTGVPLPYLSKILHTLHRRGVICGKRGYRGGFSLAQPANEITLFDVIEAVEGKWQPQCLLGLTECSASPACPVHVSWVEQRRKIEQSLRKVSLSDFADYSGRRRLTSAAACSCGGAGRAKANMESTAQEKGSAKSGSTAQDRKRKTTTRG